MAMLVREIDFDDSAPTSLRAVFEGARKFGLADDAVWQAFDDVLYAVGDERPVGEYVDHVAGALAARILAEQRTQPATTTPDPPRRRRTLFGR
jgi:hypothetical protein